MPREKEGFRDMVALLNEFYPGAAVVTIEQCMTILQYKSKSTVREYLIKHKVPVENGRVNKIALARAMCS